MPRTRTPPPSAPARTQPAARPRRRIARWTAILLLGAGAVGAGWLGYVRLRSAALAPARAALARGDLQAAARLAAAHLDRFRSDPEAALIAARSLSRLGRPEQAEAFFRRAGQLAPDDAHLRAFGLLRADDREAAIRAYGAILDDRPGDILALRRLAAIYLSQGRYRDAGAVARRLIEAPGGAVIGHTLEGVAHHNMAESAEAAAAFERVLELDPDLREMPLTPPRMFWAYLTHDLLALGQHESVKRHARRALERGPDAGLLHDLALAHYQSGELDEAERAWRASAELAPDYPPPWLYLGRIDLARGRADRAVESLERAVRLAPDASEPNYSLSLALRQLGRTEDAERYRREADRIRDLNARSASGGRP